LCISFVSNNRGRLSALVIGVLLLFAIVAIIISIVIQILPFLIAGIVLITPFAAAYFLGGGSITKGLAVILFSISGLLILLQLFYLIYLQVYPGQTPVDYSPFFYTLLAVPWFFGGLVITALRAILT